MGGEGRRVPAEDGERVREATQSFVAVGFVPRIGAGG